MNTLKPVSVEPQDIDELEHQDVVAAKRYIDAILNRQPVGRGSAESADLRRELWERFVVEYRNVSTGPYARRGGVALRLALGRL